VDRAKTDDGALMNWLQAPESESGQRQITGAHIDWVQAPQSEQGIASERRRHAVGVRCFQHVHLHDFRGVEAGHETSIPGPPHLILG